MKVNLLRNSPNILSGYVNIDGFAKPDESDKIAGDITNLDHSVDDGECDEIIADDIINYLDMSIAGHALANWSKKLKRGGRLIVGAINVHFLARAVLTEGITIQQMNEVIHGAENTPWNVKKSTHSVDNLSFMMERCGIKIVSARMNGLRFVLIGERI